MSNTFGSHFRLTTFGESHGPCVGGVIDGCPSGLVVDNDLVRSDLDRRSGIGIGHTTARKEPDEVQWMSGLLYGVTLGTPLAFMVENKDARSGDYAPLRDVFRPGHCDYTWEKKYGIRDWRGGGRSSARETVARVVAGSIAKQILAQRGIKVSSSYQCPSDIPHGDTVGGTVCCTIEGVPVGVGQPLFGKLQCQLASAMMSIPSATGFEFGEGFQAAQMCGSEYIDCWNSDFTTQTNHCGGLQGGLSNGMPIVIRVAFHPVVTLSGGMPCIDRSGAVSTVVPYGRHDVSQVPRAAVVVEAMAALTIVDNIL